MDLARAMMIGGRYRLERLLGEGGMGTVWVAEDTAAGGLCALKLMKDAAGDPEARKRFLREGLAVSTVRHPNVVRILEVLEPEGEPPAIVMELLEGESLRELLRRQRQLSVVELAEIMLPVVSAVGTAHALGIVHRDLKPENIFVVIGAGGERVVKVLDFGIAKLTALDSEAVRATGITTGAVLGTPAYMAPEQIFAERDLDHRADVWALGVIFYECLAGVCPTDGDNVGQVLKHVVSKPFVAVSDLVPELPESVSRLVTRMLARESLAAAGGHARGTRGARAVRRLPGGAVRRAGVALDERPRARGHRAARRATRRRREEASRRQSATRGNPANTSHAEPRRARRRDSGCRRRRAVRPAVVADLVTRRRCRFGPRPSRRKDRVPRAARLGCRSSGRLARSRRRGSRLRARADHSRRAPRADAGPRRAPRSTPRTGRCLPGRSLRTARSGGALGGYRQGARTGVPGRRRHADRCRVRSHAGAAPRQRCRARASHGSRARVVRGGAFGHGAACRGEPDTEGE